MNKSEALRAVIEGYKIRHPQWKDENLYLHYKDCGFVWSDGVKIDGKHHTFPVQESGYVYYQETETEEKPVALKSINLWVQEIHENAKNKGWYEDDRSPLEMHMLMVSEIAEATEEVRSKKADVYSGNAVGSLNVKEAGTKPEGEAIELVDCVVRIFDYFGSKGWDFEELLKLKTDYNKTRSHKHGNKKY